MLVANIQGALGNQLFAYAATKSIALDLGFEYRYRVIRLGPAPTSPVRDHDGAYFLKSSGHDYNYHFERAFHIDTEERIADIPSHLRERWDWERLPETNFNRDVYDVRDNTSLNRFFLSPKYFEHRKGEVLKWFRFRESYRTGAEKNIKEIREKTHATHTVALHIRYAKDLRIHGRAVDPSYYIRAVEKMKTIMSGEKLCFIVLSDVPSLAANILKTCRNDFIFQQGTTFDDLCLMTMCDSHIISNSTFSWWGAWLSESTKGIVIRPSLWPTTHNRYIPFVPQDIFPSHWIPVEARKVKLTVRIVMDRCRDVYPTVVLSGLRKIKSAIAKALKILMPDILLTTLKSLRRGKI